MLTIRSCAAVLLAAGLAACSDSDSKVKTDRFDRNSLGSYSIDHTAFAWTDSSGYMVAGPTARQSAALRKGETMTDGWVETAGMQIADGGLVLRASAGGKYYLLAIRDDSWFPGANLEMYRADGGTFQRIAGPLNVSWPNGTYHTVRFQAKGTDLTAYVDGDLLMTATDPAYTSGGFGLRADDSSANPYITSQFDYFRWSAL